MADFRSAILARLAGDRSRILGDTSTAGVKSSLAELRGKTLGSLAAEREGVLGDLASERKQILADTSGADVRADLANEREGILASVRGDNAGPQMFPRHVRPNMGQAESAMGDGNPFLAALEARYAQQVAQGQQGVQDAMLDPNSGDIIFGSGKQRMAEMERKRRMMLAAQEYNSALPAMYAGQRKSILGDGLA